MALPPGLADQGPEGAAARALRGDHLHPAASWFSGRGSWCPALPPPEQRWCLSRELRLVVILLPVFLAFPYESPKSIPPHTAVLHPREITVTRFKSQMAAD